MCYSLLSLCTLVNSSVGQWFSEDVIMDKALQCSLICEEKEFAMDTFMNMKIFAVGKFLNNIFCHVCIHEQRTLLWELL